MRIQSKRITIGILGQSKFFRFAGWVVVHYLFVSFSVSFLDDHVQLHRVIIPFRCYLLGSLVMYVCPLL